MLHVDFATFSAIKNEPEASEALRLPRKIIIMHQAKIKPVSHSFTKREFRSSQDIDRILCLPRKNAPQSHPQVPTVSNVHNVQRLPRA
jgi:hypothetical protein